MFNVVRCGSNQDFEQFGRFEPLMHYLVGFLAGASGVITGHPLDTVKIRQQTEAQSIYRCCTLIIKNEGFSGFFKGMSSPLMSFGAIHAIAFGVYGNTIKFFEDKHILLGSFVAGIAAGIAQCSICVPSDLIKTKMQLQTDNKRALYRSSFDCARKMIITRGFSSLFKGTWITMARDGPGYGTWFASYEYFTQKFSQDGTAQSLTTLQLIFAGGISGIMSWICNYPIDVIKTRFQADDNISSYRQVCSDIARTRGLRGFFAGISTTFLRAFPANAAIFFTAEWSYRMLRMIVDWHNSNQR